MADNQVNRFNISEFSRPDREAQAPLSMLDTLFAPTSVWGMEPYPGTYSQSKGRSRRTRIDPLQTIQQGNQQYGLSPWESLFDESGRLTDPMAFLRSMNFANVSRSLRPVSPGTMVPELGHRQDAGPAYNPLVNWLAQISAPGRDRGSTWYGRDRQDVPGLAYNPSYLAYTDPSNFLGMNLENATLDQLNAAAQQQYGVDLMTLAASTIPLLQGRQEWSQDPSQWFNPQSPEALATTRVPGMSEADSAIRMQQYTDAYNNMMQQSQERRGTEGSTIFAQALRDNPQLMRTAMGADMASRLPMMAQDIQRNVSSMPQPVDYSYLLQRALMPSLLQRALESGMI